MILKVPDPRLSLPSDGIKFAQAKPIANKLRNEWDLYQKQHKKFRVVGLAAPQIGINKRVFLALGEVFINPEILSFIEETAKIQEGCCSLPNDDVYEVDRHLEVKLKWINRQRKLMVHTFYDIEAAIIQHECDHLNGIVISDYDSARLH